MNTLQERIDQVESRIQNAVRRSGRARDEITLVAVTKKFPAAVICEAYSLGLRAFGENYVQEFAEKRPALSGLAEAQFHLIGHLQSNKARQATELFQTMETVDSEKLARRLNESEKRLEVMIEVKLSPEGTKAGADPEELPALIDAIRACPNLRLTGLMTMPPWNPDPETTRPFFRRLNELARIHQLPKLSMGMSHDLEAAIEEGATHIRVGTALFGPRPKPSADE
ncbi:MAG: alanine racemase domain protein [Bryobacterales bacterium]|nr:alanine racemase domain protein [Bryobacterales bacterium]